MIGPRVDATVRGAVAALVCWLAIAHAAAFLVPSTWINRDGRFYTNMVVTLVEDGTLEQSRFAASWYSGAHGWNRTLPPGFSNVALGRNGEHWPMHPWLMPVLTAPFYLALGLPGTLLFNLLGFAVAALGAYRFARDHASPTASAAATGVLLLGTGILDYAYDYHVDVFLLAVVATAVAALLDRSGVVAGAFTAAALVIKPTSVLLLPFLLGVLWERRDGRTFRRALVGGAIVLAVVGAANTVMFGAPWTFGYMRIVTVVDGEEVLDRNAAAFSMPLGPGLERLWRGHWGLRHTMTLIGLAAPGLIARGVRGRALYALTALGTVAAAVLVFARYAHEGHRFLWPAILTLVPALAATFDGVRGAAVRALARLGRRPRGAVGPALVAATLAVAAVSLSAAWGPPLADRLATDGYALGARALGRHASLDPAVAPRLDPAAVGTPGVRPTTLSRFGTPLPRSSPAPTLLAAPFAAVGGWAGLAGLHGLLAAALAFAAAWRLAPLVGAGPTVAGVGGLVLLPGVRDALLAGGPPLFAAAALAVALALVGTRRYATAAALGAFAAWSADAPTLLAVPLVALGEARRAGGSGAMRRPAIALAVVLAAWGLGHLALYGYPFASPDDYVLVRLAGAGGDAVAAAVPRAPLGARALEAALDPQGGAGLTLAVLAAGGLLGLVGLVATDAGRPVVRLALGLAWAGALFAPVTEDASPMRLAPLVAVALALAAPAAAVAASGLAAPRLVALSPPRRLAVLGAALAALLAVGGARAAAGAGHPFRIETREAVRTARVVLGDVPCDFLAWEHYAWECSHFDRGTMNLTGLATSVEKTVGGRPSRLFVLASGLRGQPRSVTWDDVPATGRLDLRWAVPDGHRGGGPLRVLVDGEVVGRELVPVEPDPEGVRTWTLDTEAWAGRRVTLRLEVAPGPAGPTTLLVGGGFR